MSTNDLILLNQLLDQRLSEVGEGLSENEYFEIFASEQVLKDGDLSYDELVAGVVDGGGDGGLDSFFFFVNGTLFSEDVDLATLKRNAMLRIVVIQAKTSSGFSEGAIEKMISSARDLFDLNRDLNGISGIYNRGLIDKVAAFRKTYLALTSKFPSLAFEYAYATKGTEVHPHVSRKTSVLEQTIRGIFNPVSVSFRFLTASDLLTSARRQPLTTSSLRLAENPISTGQEGFVCLVSIRDYLDFITEDGHLRSHLFEGNVRDYQGRTEVNKEIRATLEITGSEDFWWLNNGVSVICSNASLSGKTLTIEDAEIVNGLQTSREIYQALHGKDLSKESRNLLVRVIKPQSQESRDRIIKATNSQTPIPAASLRATDKIHRDIEEYLYAKGYYYDRRKNYYKNIGKPIKKILGIPLVAQSVMACALYAPASARARPSSLIRSEEDYKKIFNEAYPLDIYLKCPLIVRAVEDILRQSGNEDLRKHSTNLVFYVAMLWVLQSVGKLAPTIEQIAKIDLTVLQREPVLLMAERVWDEYLKLGGNDQTAKGPKLQQILIAGHREQAMGSLNEEVIGQIHPA